MDLVDVVESILLHETVTEKDKELTIKYLIDVISDRKTIQRIAKFVRDTWEYEKL